MNKQTNTLFSVVILLSIIFSACAAEEVEQPAQAEASVEVVEINTAEGMANRIRFQDRVMARTATVADSEAAGSGSVMAARIHFHDKVWAQTAATGYAGKQSDTSVEITMADRIGFHDRLASPALEISGMSQADRIRFHDRLWEEKR